MRGWTIAAALVLASPAGAQTLSARVAPEIAGLLRALGATVTILPAGDEAALAVSAAEGSFYVYPSPCPHTAALCATLDFAATFRPLAMPTAAMLDTWNQRHDGVTAYRDKAGNPALKMRLRLFGRDTSQPLTLGYRDWTAAIADFNRALSGKP